MNINNSPWIQQIQRTRPVDYIQGDTSADVVIVGGGIAGVSTAYFILKNTDKKVLLIEAGKVAHGATGHNAGQIVSYFEKQLAGIVETFGIDLAIRAQRDIDSTWSLLQEICSDLKLQTPFYEFSGFAGISDIEEIMMHLKNALLYRTYGLNTEDLLIAEDSHFVSQIPKEYANFYTTVPAQDILELIETKNSKYIAAIVARKGCMNSASFSEEVVGSLLANYSDRFSLFEQSPVTKITLNEYDACLDIHEYKVTANKVVLCTNGFEKFTITNTAGPAIDKKFHQNIKGTIGYMSGYIDERNRTPMAISYIDTKDSVTDPYFYLTRRPYDGEQNQKHNLICVGGPDLAVEDTSSYSKTEHLYSENIIAKIDTFLHSTYAHAPETIVYKYKWHGLMGYTPNGVRMIGVEPYNPVLLYNVGCNGVGILPSIFGGSKIARIIKGDTLEPSIFDPQ